MALADLPTGEYAPIDLDNPWEPATARLAAALNVDRQATNGGDRVWRVLPRYHFVSRVASPVLVRACQDIERCIIFDRSETASSSADASSYGA